MGPTRQGRSDKLVLNRGSVPLSGAGHVQVIYPHIEDKQHRKVLQAIRNEGFDPLVMLTPKADPYSYSTLIRDLWHRGVGFHLVEQHALPPVFGLRKMQECDALVCSRPHDCRRKGVMGSLACVKFSTALVRQFPDLADRILARPRPEEWWRAGLLNLPPWFEGCARPSGLRNATVNTAAIDKLGEWPNANYPTTQEWPHSDTVLFAEMARLGIETHYHDRPSVCFPDPDEQLVQ